jgi:hypothetical protein
MRCRGCPIFVVALLWACLACAAPATNATIDELMHKSGLWEQLAGIDNVFQRSLDADAARHGVGEQHAAALRQAFKVAYGPEKLRPAVAAVLAERLTAEDAQDALAWLATDLGTRITKLEEASTAQARPERPTELLDALPPERRAVYARLAQALHSGDVGATMMINVAYGLAYGIRIAAPQVNTQDPEQLRKQLVAMRPLLVAKVQEQTMASFAITYATLTDAELERYAAFAETPAGQRYHAASSIALDTALSAAAVDVGRLLPTMQLT